MISTIVNKQIEIKKFLLFLNHYYFMKLFRIVFLLLTLNVFGQNVDSVLLVINKAEADSTKLRIYVENLLRPLDLTQQYDLLEKHSLEAFNLAKTSNNLQRKVESGVLLSAAYFNTNNEIKSINLINDLIKESKVANDKIALSRAYRAKANYYNWMSNYTEAIRFFIETQKINEELKDPIRMAGGYQDLGAVNFYVEHFAKAAEYFEKAIAIYEVTPGYEKSVGSLLGNLGIVYIESNNLYKAEVSLKKALSLNIKMNNLTALANTYTNLCKLEYEKKDINKALEYNKKAIDIMAETNDEAISNNYSNRAELLRTLKKYDEAIVCINKAFEIENKKNNKTFISDLYLNRAALYYDLGKFNEAYEDQRKHIEIEDSLINVDNQHNINDLEKKYELDQKEKQNQILNQQIEIHNVESSRQRILTSFVVVILIVVVLIAFVFIRQNRIRKKANLDLSKKNKIIEEQHKDITDSIKYSKRIQEAILPPEKMWYDILPNSFLLYKPKDILSGDFYWVEETADYVFLAAADCTGHGVPGALMSIVNYNLLNKAVLEKGIYDPGEILSAVNIWLTHSLHQTYNSSSIKDGMDVSLVSINKKNLEVKFAGAFNSLYHFSENDFKELRGDKFPVGAFIEESIKTFTTQSFIAKPGDHLYIFSDGFADQFGGPKGKKYKYNKLKDCLTANKHLKPLDQKRALEAEFEAWKGNNEQVDDVLVIGLKL